ncbi:hypothetical protein BGX27_008376 [Mortierella sp. AM989]|nr:hypothetical protein BGX27_008376 [Mortierella sp. AM989]
MDAEDNHLTSQHRPPVLFQSHEQDQVAHGHHEFNDHMSSPLHPLSYGPGDEALNRYRPDFDHDDEFFGCRGALEEEPAAHVHSQSCRDSCPVQDIYTETSYSPFGKGARTNLYGLAVVKELENVSPPPPSQLPSSHPVLCPQMPNTDTFNTPVTPGTNFKKDPSKGSNIFTSEGVMAYSQLPARYVLIAAGGAIKCFMGLQETFEFTLGATAIGNNSNAGSGTESTTGARAGSENGQGSATANTNSSMLSNQEIVSLDAFERKDARGCQLVVVVSIARGEDPTLFELRFYGANTFGSSIRELLLRLPTTTDIQSIPLSWAPTKIIHSPAEVDPFEMAVLVAGSDSCVHYFVQIPSQSELSIFEERSVESDISIFASFPYCEYCVLSLVIKDYSTCRVVAAGTQNGTLNVSIIPRDPKTLKLDRANANNHTVVLFAPITTLTFFSSRVQPEGRKWTSQENEEDQSRQRAEASGDPHILEESDKKYMTDISEEGIHLLVTCAIEQAWVYSNINKYGLSQRSDLAECSHHDSILTAYIMDSDWDGRNELMIGTYGRQLMVFKELPSSHAPFPPTANSEHLNYSHYLHSQNQDYTLQQHPSNLPNLSHLYYPSHLPHLEAPASSPSVAPNSPIPQWSMTWNRRFATPVYGISSADLNDDGLEELVITTLDGVSIFLPDPQTAKRRLAQAVNRMKEIEEMRLTLERLRKSNGQLWEKHREKQKREEERELKERFEKEEAEQLKRGEKEPKEGEEEENEEEKEMEGEVGRAEAEAKLDLEGKGATNALAEEGLESVEAPEVEGLLQSIETRKETNDLVVGIDRTESGQQDGEKMLKDIASTTEQSVPEEAGLDDTGLVGEANNNREDVAANLSPDARKDQNDEAALK